MKQNDIAPKIRLKIVKLDGTTRSVVSRKRMRIISIIKRDPGSEFELSAVYQEGVSNSAFAPSKDVALKILQEWTSKDQIDFVRNGEWE